jgi:hypothetical protein
MRHGWLLLSIPGTGRQAPTRYTTDSNPPFQADEVRRLEDWMKIEACRGTPRELSRKRKIP